jgi:hypothetical protein
MEERPSLTPPCSTSPSGALLLSSPPRAPSFESAFGSSIFAIGTVCRRTSGLSISVTAFGASGLLEVAMVVSSSIQMQETPTPFLRCLPQLIERPYRPRGAKEEIKNHTQHGRLEAPDRSKLRPPRQHHNGRPKQIRPRQHHPQSSQWQKNTCIPNIQSAGTQDHGAIQTSAGVASPVLPLPRVQLWQAQYSRPVAQPLSTGYRRPLSGLVVAPGLHPLDLYTFRN